MIGKFAITMADYAINRDFPWILQTGRYILVHNIIPQTDIFSWTLPNQSWTLYQWLFEVFIALSEKYLGIDYLIRVFIILTISIYILIPLAFHQIHADPNKKTSAFFSLVISSICLYIISTNISLRPMIVSSFFLLIQYLLLNSFQRNKIKLLVLIPIIFCLYCLWANMHLGVTLGFISLVSTFVGNHLDSLESNSYQQFSEKPQSNTSSSSFLQKYFPQILLLTAFLGSLINPYGLNVYPYLANIHSQGYMNQLIGELRSPDFHWPVFQLFLFLFFVFIVLSYLSTGKKKFINNSEFLHLLVFSFMTFVTARIVVWACLFYALILPIVIQRVVNEYTQYNPNFILKSIGDDFEYLTKPFISIILIGIFTFITFPNIFKINKNGECAPVMKAINTYQKQLKADSDRAIVDDLIGGCSLLNYPSEKVFIDTRFDFYAENFVKAWRVDFIEGKNFTEYIKRWNLNTFILQKNWPAAIMLNKSTMFTKIYEDKVVVIFRKSS